MISTVHLLTLNLHPLTNSFESIYTFEIQHYKGRMLMKNRVEKGQFEKPTHECLKMSKQIKTPDL